MTTQRPLNKRQRAFVAAYIGEAAGNGTLAARLAGYHGNDATLSAVAVENLRKPLIAAQIAAHAADLERQGIALKQNRIDSYVRDYDLTERIRRERAHFYEGKAPGGSTGLIVGRLRKVSHTEKKIDGAVQSWTEETWEYVLDTGLLDERRQLCKQIAQELGEWTERRDVTGRVGIDLASADSAFEALVGRIARIAERQSDH